jgi:hypothetical protein
VLAVEASYRAALSGNGITPSLQVHLITVDTVLAVWDPVQKTGEFLTIMTISNNYNVLAIRGG